jgi:hypothetical protein
MRITKATAVAMAGAFLVALAAGASAIKMKKTELPEAVREAVEHAAPGAHVSACWRLTGYGDAMYEVDLKVDGRKRGVVISSEGKVLTVQEEVAWEDVPGGAQESLKREARDHDIEEVHSIWQHGELVGYGARIDGDGPRDYNFEVGPHGEAFRGDSASRLHESRRPSPKTQDRESPPPDQPSPQTPDQ